MRMCNVPGSAGSSSPARDRGRASYVRCVDGLIELLAERILARIRVEDRGYRTACWVWPGMKNDGYGRIFVPGTNRRRRKLTHRVLFEFFVGEIPAHLEIDHLCRQHDCCNPDHLDVVTSRENTLRGLGPEVCGARNRSKTHCKHGHAFTPENTRRSQRGRECKACNNARHRARYHRIKTAPSRG